MAANPIDGFTVAPGAIGYVGADLSRPECVLAQTDGTLWVSDARQGVMRIGRDGGQRLIATRYGAGAQARARTERSLPNGLALARDGSVLIANAGTAAFEVMAADGETRVICDTIEGVPLGAVNFILRDSRDRLWLSVHTRNPDWRASFSPNVADGYVALLDERGVRIVADGFAGTNELRLDAREQRLYVVETTAKRISRLRVGAGGSLSGREVFGPSSLGLGFPDGIAFDAHGNLWGTLVIADRIFALTPEGDLRILLDDCNVAPTEALERAFAADAVTPEVMMAAHGTIAPWMSSLAFAGADGRTVHVGSLRGTRIATFRAPVAGLAMSHWA